MPRRAASALERSILGLLLAEPRTGYALRRLLAAMPFGRVSASPGAIYPALRRLQRAGHLESAPDRTHPRRPARIFRLAPRGRRAVLAWLRAGIDREEAARRPEESILRLAFLPFTGRAADTTRFLLRYRDAMAAEAAEGRRRAATLPQAARLALEHKVSLYGARARWARRALRASPSRGYPCRVS